MRGAGLGPATIAKRIRNHAIRHLPLAERMCKAGRRGYVVMIHIGRSGSTVVGDLLNQHPKISWDGEIYQSLFKEREAPNGSLRPIDDVDPVSYLRTRSSRLFGAFYGFEVKFFHLRLLGVELAAYLDRLEQELPNLGIIVLERRNRLRMIVSAVAARSTGAYHVPRGGAAALNRIRLDPNSILIGRSERSLTDHLQQFDADFANLFKLLDRRRYLHLAYEEHVLHDPRAACRQVLEHLDLRPMRMGVRYQRSNPYPLHDIVDNYDDLRAALRGTPYEWMLEDLVS